MALPAELSDGNADVPGGPELHGIHDKAECAEPGPSRETPRSLENDGHRTVPRRTEGAVILYARSGRIVTSHWMDLAASRL